MKKAFQILSLIFFILVSGIMSIIVFGYSHIPNEISMDDYNQMSPGKSFVCCELNETPANIIVNKNACYETSVKLFNIFPVKKTKVNVSDRKYLVPGGNIFGIRLYTKGVMVVKIEGVQTQDKKENPGLKAGLRKGDIILSVDGVNISDNDTLSKIISSSDGKTLVFEVERNKKILNIEFTPILSSDNTYKGGLWIRDSTAGIGTVTFYDSENNIFGGLGHAICDVDTGEVMPLSGGDAVKATVKGCYKGTKGVPGELCGVFNGKSLGPIYINNETGIYGVINNTDNKNSSIPVALPAEAKEGKAQIISTVDENGPEYYDIEITKIYNGNKDNRNMIIKVTDEKLLKKTGGIVQGMSGSPIIQNNMLIGAVTHVFVDNATEGYGIFAENMIKTEENLEKNISEKAS